ncbi:MAG: DUF1501 domain-containing protein, partial [Ferruginibacter sp.]|nr:DUF1501 domain-containing protein [Cytophagales bacterium]
MGTRRDFLKNSALVTAGTTLIPNFLKAFERNRFGAAPVTNKILVVVQLSGGNDGLNTVVPYRNDIYYRERPGLAIPRAKVLPLNDEIGFNPALAPLREIFDEGLMTILHNVGYPNPDRSHFRSMDIWHTGSDSGHYRNTGWLGRYLDANCPVDCRKPHDAIEVDDTLSLAMKGEKTKGLALLNPEKLRRQIRSGYLAQVSAGRPSAGGPSEAPENVDYLYQTLAETLSSADYLYDQSKVYQTKTTYPANELGNRLRTVAELILSGVNTNVYYVSMAGFDTHVNQLPQQAHLLGVYAAAMGAFTRDLKENRRLDDVMIMTFSEFGRRVKQNASNGTDHGTANNLFLINGRLKGGRVFNEVPNLADLDEGDLKYTVDFRRVYATLLRRWLQADD